jgi:hypothetical protein
MAAFCLGHVSVLIIQANTVVSDMFRDFFEEKKGYVQRYLSTC